MSGRTVEEDIMCGDGKEAIRSIHAPQNVKIIHEVSKEDETPIPLSPEQILALHQKKYGKDYMHIIRNNIR